MLQLHYITAVIDHAFATQRTSKTNDDEIENTVCNIYRRATILRPRGLLIKAYTDKAPPTSNMVQLSTGRLVMV